MATKTWEATSAENASFNGAWTQTRTPTSDDRTIANATARIGAAVSQGSGRNQIRLSNGRSWATWINDTDDMVIAYTDDDWVTPNVVVTESAANYDRNAICRTSTDKLYIIGITSANTLRIVRSATNERTGSPTFDSVVDITPSGFTPASNSECCIVVDENDFVHIAHRTSSDAYYMVSQNANPGSFTDAATDFEPFKGAAPGSTGAEAVGITVGVNLTFLAVGGNKVAVGMLSSAGQVIRKSDAVSFATTGDADYHNETAAFSSSGTQGALVCNPNNVSELGFFYRVSSIPRMKLSTDFGQTWGSEENVTNSVTLFMIGAAHYHDDFVAVCYDNNGTGDDIAAIYRRRSDGTWGQTTPDFHDTDDRRFFNIRFSTHTSDESDTIDLIFEDRIDGVGNEDVAWLRIDQAFAATDDLVLDGTSVQDCTWDRTDGNYNSLTITSAYTGAFAGSGGAAAALDYNGGTVTIDSSSNVKAVITDAVLSQTTELPAGVILGGNIRGTLRKGVRRSIQNLGAIAKVV